MPTNQSPHMPKKSSWSTALATFNAQWEEFYLAMQDRVETSKLHLAKSHSLNISDQDKSNAMALQVRTCLVCTTNTTTNTRTATPWGMMSLPTSSLADQHSPRRLWTIETKMWRVTRLELTNDKVSSKSTKVDRFFDIVGVSIPADI